MGGTISMTDDIETTLKEEDGMLSVEVTMPRDHQSLDGSSIIEAPVVVAEIDIRNDGDIVKAVSDILGEWYAEQQDSEQQDSVRGPVKSVTQKMDEAYDR
ncbi:hypothetical protein OSG_eHPD7_00155 [environmental Halophage eHP-D7]|nr:hypothetical protein OSG_eHPD7_00155 [environmental Halophage eHP-D7]